MSLAMVLYYYFVLDFIHRPFLKSSNLKTLKITVLKDGSSFFGKNGKTNILLDPQTELFAIYKPQFNPQTANTGSNGDVSPLLPEDEERFVL
jgi:hypothetical protein